MAQCLSFYTWCSPLGVGCYLYTDVKRTTPVSAGWVSDGTTSWVINSSGMITGAAACSYNYYAYRLAVTSPVFSIFISWIDCSNNFQSINLYNPGNDLYEHIIDCAVEGSIYTNVYMGIQRSVYAVADPTNPNQCTEYSYPTPLYDGSQNNNVMIWKNCNGDRQIQYFYNPNSQFQPGPTSAFNFCARGSVVFQASPRVTKSSELCLPYGTYMGQTCIDCHLYNVYADGNGGTYNTIEELNSPTCECGFTDYYCSCYGYDCDPYPNPCYYYSCSSCTF